MTKIVTTYFYCGEWWHKLISLGSATLRTILVAVIDKIAWMIPKHVTKEGKQYLLKLINNNSPENSPASEQLAHLMADVWGPILNIENI